MPQNPESTSGARKENNIWPPLEKNIAGGNVIGKSGIENQPTHSRPSDMKVLGSNPTFCKKDLRRGDSPRSPPKNPRLREEVKGGLRNSPAGSHLWRILLLIRIVSPLSARRPQLARTQYPRLQTSPSSFRNTGYFLHLECTPSFPPPRAYTFYSPEHAG